MNMPRGWRGILRLEAEATPAPLPRPRLRHHSQNQGHSNQAGILNCLTKSAYALLQIAKGRNTVYCAALTRSGAWPALRLTAHGRRTLATDPRTTHARRRAGIA